MTDEKLKDPNKHIGFKLKSLRLKEGLSQQNVADDLGMSAAAYSKIENGRTSMSVNRLMQISDYFKVFVADLLDYRVVVPRNVQEIGELSENDQIHVKKYLLGVLNDLQTSYIRGR